MSSEVPEADAQEQRTPVQPQGPADLPGSHPLEAPDADYLDQQRPLMSSAGGPSARADSEAPEADLLEQGEELPGEEEEEYPPPTGAGGQ